MEILRTLRGCINLTQEELARKLNVDPFTISQYEAKRNTPSFKVLLKMIEIFQITFDFLVRGDNCQYPKNLKLLNLAKNFDNILNTQFKNNIEMTAQTLLGNKINQNTVIKEDLLDIQMGDSFNSNLKQVRTLRDVKSVELAKLLITSSSVIGKYEKKNYPSLEKLIKISDHLNISIHALATGNKLHFDFNDRDYGKTILLADQMLSIEQQKILITLMETILKNSST